MYNYEWVSIGAWLLGVGLWGNSWDKHDRLVFGSVAVLIAGGIILNHL